MDYMQIILMIVLITTLVIEVAIFFALKHIKHNGQDVSYFDTIAEIKRQNDLLEKSLRAYFDALLATSNNSSDLLLKSVEGYNKNVTDSITKLANIQTAQLNNIERRLNEILKDNDAKLNRISDTISNNLKSIQEGNEAKLEQMRQTVDEKLSTTLEKRLSESVKIIVNGIDIVSKGIGEMQDLANGVGDLKRVLTNVKTRGGWGEVQLSSLLEQILSKTQYREQVQIKQNSSERVDFAVVLPGKAEKELLLPIDAKFPMEDYSRLCSASEQNNLAEMETQIKNLEQRIKEEAKSIYEKYISPPQTTDFAVMYLPVEGLYAEVIRRPALVETLQHKYKIMVCGPTTLTALLNSLQMGFKTLAIEKRSSEIWNTLSLFKIEFSKFVELISKTQKKIEEASNTLESASKKTKTIQRKLKDVTDIEPNSTPIDDTDFDAIGE